MYTLHHKKKQKQKTGRSPGTKICKECLELIKNMYIYIYIFIYIYIYICMYKFTYIFINKNKSKNLYWSGLNIDKRK